MITRLLYTLISFFSLCCSFHPSKESKINLSGLKTIGIFDSLPWLSNTAIREEDNFVFYPPEEIKLISFFKQYRVYRIPSYRRWDSIHVVNDSLIERRTYKTDTSYYYYARQDTAPVVYRFSSLDFPVFIKLPSDSLYKHTSDFKEPSLFESKILQYARKTGSYIDGDRVTDIYISLSARPENAVDTCYMIYSKNKFWNDISYTISFTAEMQKGMKLVKYRLAFKGDPAKKELYMRQSKSTSSEIIEVHPSNEKELLNAFLAFEKFLGEQ